jgi:hypothetical protein
MTDMTDLELVYSLPFVPLLTISEANSRGHWSARAKRVKAQRWAMTLVLGVRPGFIPSSMVVRLTRMSARSLDTDNLASAFKAVRDQIAEWLGVDDGDPNVVWVYAQQLRARRGISVEIFSTEAPFKQGSAARAFGPA